MRRRQQADRPRLGTLGCAGLWIWVGLLCGFVDAAHAASSRHLLSKFINQPADYVWMMPFSYLVVFGVLGLLHSAVSRAVPRLGALPVVVFAPVAFATFCLNLSFAWLHPVARLALSLGVGFVAARFAAARPGVVLQIYRRTFVGSVLVLLVAGAAVPLFSALSERGHRAALPDPAPDAPNVLLIVLDTVRADHMGVYGYDRPTTPSIDRLAGRSVVFDMAIATAPWTLPSHVSMFTGRYPHEADADWEIPLGDAHPTLAEVLSAHGYATAGFVGNLRYCAAEQGLARGFERYEDFLVEPSVIATSSSLGRKLTRWTRFGDPFFTLLRNNAETITDRFSSWAAEQGERPFFAFLNYFDAHSMYLAPEPFDTTFGRRSEKLYAFYSRGLQWSAWSEQEQQGFVDAYDGCLRYIDEQIEQLAAGLAQRGQLDDTLIIVTADHGEMFGEHDLFDHGHCMYQPLLRVPLILRFPGRVAEGKRIAETVSLRDLPATILDLIGIPREQSLPGHSLAALWSGLPGAHVSSPALSEISQRIGGPRDLPASQGDMKSLYVDGLHYIQNGDDSEELYDVRADPDELHNLIGTSPAVPRLRAALAEALK